MAQSFLSAFLVLLTANVFAVELFAQRPAPLQTAPLQKIVGSSVSQQQKKEAVDALLNRADLSAKNVAEIRFALGKGQISKDEVDAKLVVNALRRPLPQRDGQAWHETFLALMTLAGELEFDVVSTLFDVYVDLDKDGQRDEATVRTMGKIFPQLIRAIGLPQKLQAKLAEYFVNQTVADDASPVDIANTCQIIAHCSELTAVKKTEYAKELRPLIEQENTNDGSALTVHDKCGIAVTIRLLDPTDETSVDFLISQAKNDVSTAFIFLGRTQSKKAIPVLLEKLEKATRPPDIMMLCMSLNSLEPFDPAVQDKIDAALEQVGESTKKMFDERFRRK